MAGYVKRVSYPDKGGNAAFCSKCNGYKHKPGCELFSAESDGDAKTGRGTCALGGACGKGFWDDEHGDADKEPSERGGASRHDGPRNTEAFREERRKQAQSAVTPVSKTARRKVRVSALTPEAAANAVKTPEEERAVMGRGPANRD